MKNNNILYLRNVPKGVKAFLTKEARRGKTSLQQVGLDYLVGAIKKAKNASNKQATTVK